MNLLHLVTGAIIENLLEDCFKKKRDFNLSQYWQHMEAILACVENFQGNGHRINDEAYFWNGHQHDVYHAFHPLQIAQKSSYFFIIEKIYMHLLALNRKIYGDDSQCMKKKNTCMKRKPHYDKGIEDNTKTFLLTFYKRLNIGILLIGPFRKLYWLS